MNPNIIQPNQNIEQKLNLLESENALLKNKLQSLSEKESLYKSNLEKIKSIQSEQENQYFNSLKDSKRREDELKQKFLDFQKLLENQYTASEARFNEEMNQMSQEISKRDIVINNLKNELNQLEEKMAQEELNFGFKEKEFENVIKIKERKLEELNEAVKQITKDATEEIKRMGEQLEDLQMKSKNNINNNTSPMNNNNFSNNKSNYISENSGNFILNNQYINELKNENLRLKIQNKNLTIELDKRNNEISFWKNKNGKLNIMNNGGNNSLKELEINQLKRTLVNYGNKIKLINEQYKNFISRHQREKKSLLNQIKNLNNIIMQNRISNKVYNNKLNKYNNINNEINNNPDIKNINEDYPNNDNININQYNSSDINNIADQDNLYMDNNDNVNDIDNINENLNDINDINDINSLQNLNELNMNNLQANENQYLNAQGFNENDVTNDIKELNSSNNDENVNEINNNYEEVYEPLDDINQNLNINDNININNANNLALINRMQNNIPSIEAKRNEFINNQLKNLPKSDYEE